MKRVEAEITAYLNDDDVCNDGEDMFPRRSSLTGEWYVSWISFPRASHLSIGTAFLGTDSGEADDYLGLEVLFSYNEAAEKFDFQGINSESL